MLSSITQAISKTRTANRIFSPSIGAVRYLNIHEYVSMELFNEHGIATPSAFVAETPEEAEHIYAVKMQDGTKRKKDAVIKAQVLSGGRGLGTFKNGFQGGVHMVTKPGQAKEFASQMLGQELVTKQAPDGIICNKVFLMERMYIRSEMYLSLLMDRNAQGPVLVGSPRGGTSIEDVAKSNPELIFTEIIDIVEGIQDDQCDRMATNIGLEVGSETHTKAVTLMKNLYKMFKETDCTQIEINPLAETPEGEVVVCDAKVNFDSNAEYRQKSIFGKRDVTQEDPREVEASKYDLNYIGLSGNIGCMVNGAGLAMSTMDIIQLKGGSPANFLDVGGGATEEQVQKAFELLNSDENVEAILVNIFGGIMKCDIIATGIINAAKEIGMKKPVVIRLQGTNVEKANELIHNSGLDMILADDLDDAAMKAVGVSEISKRASELQLGIKFESA